MAGVVRTVCERQKKRPHLVDQKMGTDKCSYILLLGTFRRTMDKSIDMSYIPYAILITVISLYSI